VSRANVPHGWNSGEQLRLTVEDRGLLALPAAGTRVGLNIPLLISPIVIELSVLIPRRR
jgi:hypothetical protein